ncbi:MAG TPA: TIGR00730 family Rossman fold protein [Alphaproteobacteria bacterium]|nr:TIGR00730 family Rossman fold protein [Alphaproteobacteria bacterium]
MVRIKSLCVYCGSSNDAPDSHRAAARRLGGLLAKSGIELVFGGGHVGLMGVIADAALGAGGRVTGVIPEHLVRAEVGHAKVTELVVVKSMHERKETMFVRSDAFAVLPGGFGTLDEFFEILTWRQLRLHDRPIVLVDLDDYWRPLLHLIDHLVERRYTRPENRDLIRIVGQIDDVLPAIFAEGPPRVVAKPGKM